ncbi:hypothetical protein SLA2020_292670 [Shorea laevis]
MATARRARALLFLGLALLSCVAHGEVFGPHRTGSCPRRVLADDTNSNVFDVTKFGAKPNDDQAENFEPFVGAWRAACNATVPSTYLIPRGTFFVAQLIFQGPCSNPVTVQIQGTLKALTDISEYTSEEWIMFEIIDGLTVTGGGTLNGQGFANWQYNDCKKNSKCQLLPHSIKFNNVNNSAVYGLTSLNSMSFHVFITRCNNITAYNLNISAPSNSPNTDGIHISSSTLVNITNSTIATGDDCISIGQGNTNISVSKIVCGPGHGISVGSLGKYEDEKNVSGIYVKNCTLLNTTNGARIKTWPASPPLEASNIIFEDLIMYMVKNPVIIDQKYGSHKHDQPSKVKISKVHFRNIRGSTTSEIAINFACSSAVPCEGIEVANIYLTFNGTTKASLPPSLTSSCLNANATFGGKLNPPACP